MLPFNDTGMASSSARSSSEERHASVRPRAPPEEKRQGSDSGHGAAILSAHHLKNVRHSPHEAATAQQNKHRSPQSSRGRWKRGSPVPPIPSPSSISIVKAKCERDSEHPAPHSHSHDGSSPFSLTFEKISELASLRLFMPSCAIRAAKVSRCVTIYAPRSPPAALKILFSFTQILLQEQPQQVRFPSTLLSRSCQIPPV